MAYVAEFELQSPRGMLMLRGESPAREAFSDKLGVGLPTEPNTVAEGIETCVLWLGPDQWLVMVPETSESVLNSSLATSVTGLHAAVTVVSDHFSVFKLFGSEVAEILVQGCGLDIDPGGFSYGQCCRCAFARTTAILRPLNAGGAYEVIVESSYQYYLVGWFNRAVGPLVLNAGDGGE